VLCGGAGRAIACIYLMMLQCGGLRFEPTRAGHLSPLSPIRRTNEPFIGAARHVNQITGALTPRSPPHQVLGWGRHCHLTSTHCSIAGWLQCLTVAQPFIRTPAAMEPEGSQTVPLTHASSVSAWRTAPPEPIADVPTSSEEKKKTLTPTQNKT
jgi:hypothetical protein